ncbi:MAG: hypothetical protein E7291_05385 [Lachnospiraceae bacterium]|nr:hypothetical protein [Lachnospiraceae bacterium]
MTYEEFKRELYRNISLCQEAMGKEIRLFERRTICSDMQDLRIIKAVNLSCYGMSDVVIHEDVICALWGSARKLSMMHWKVRPLYERYKREGWQGVLPEIAMKLEQAGKESKLLFMESGSYEECRERLILRPVNFPRSREMLNNCIYWKYGDIALVLYSLLSDVGNESISMKIQREITQRWDISHDRIRTDALLNSYAKMPPRLFRAEDMISGHNPERGVFMPGEKGDVIKINRQDQWEGIRGYRLTTTKQLNGALAIFYPGVQGRLAELLGGDYLVGFTSVHEAVIHPAHCKKPGDMKAAIQHINAVFDEQDMLTNRVYLYSARRRQLMEM